MCAVSAVGDDWTRRIQPWVVPGAMPITTPEQGTSFRLGQLEADVRFLKEQAKQMKKELQAAKAQDIAEGNPDCEMEEKVALLKQFAEKFGVNLGDVLDAHVHR